MSLYRAIVLSFCLLLSQGVMATESLMAIQEAMRHDDYKSALQMLHQYSGKKDFLYSLLVAQTNLALANPRVALQYFNAALYGAHSVEEKRVALFGLSRSLLWLERYRAALGVFDTLSHLPLNREEQEAVRVGRATALMNMDYPRNAWCAFDEKHPHSPIGVITKTKTALAAGWGDKAKATWACNQAVLNTIPMHSYLKNQAQNVAWLLKQQTSHYAVGADYYRVRDSESFKVDREGIYGRDRLLGVNTNTTARVVKNRYYNPVHFANADMLLLREDLLNIRNHLDLNLGAISTRVDYQQIEEKAWHPFLWSENAIYHVNDFLSFNANNSETLVETTQALQNKILINTTEAGFFTHPWSKFYLRAVGFYSDFTDGNQRKGLSSAITAPFITELGVTAELRYRGYHNSFYSDPNYFSPYELQEGMGFLILKRRFTNTLYFSAEGGIGRQLIQQTPDAIRTTQPVTAYNLILTKIVCGMLEINVNYGYTQNAFANFVGAYAQTYFGANATLYLD